MARKLYVWIFTGALIAIGLFFVARVAILYLSPPPDDSVLTQVRDKDQQVTAWAVDWRDRLLGDPRSKKLNFDNPGPAEWEFLEKKLGSDDEESRRAAAKAMLEINQPRAFRPLIAAIRQDAPDGQFLLDTAMEILDRTSMEVRLSLLIYSYDLHSEQMPEFAIWGLRARMREEGLLDGEFLKVAVTSSPNPAWRRFAVRELAKLDPPHTGAVAAALADPDESVRSQARQTLGTLMP